MATKDLPSPEVLRQLLRYEPETGKLFWLTRGSEWFKSRRAELSWNARYVGREAGTSRGNHGYLQIGLLGQNLMVHRVAFAIIENKWPADEVDHVNGVKLDNRAANLRAASRSQNQRNRSVRSDSKTGAKGVSIHRQSGLWRFRIQAGATVVVGYRKTKDEAIAAHTAESARLHGEFGRTA